MDDWDLTEDQKDDFDNLVFNVHKIGKEEGRRIAEPKWIGVNDKLPDHGEFVLIYAPACEGSMFVGIRDEADDNFWYDPTDMSYLELKYAPQWMHLPTPPQG